MPLNADFAQHGLTSSEVAERLANGQANIQNTDSSRSLGTIIRQNTFTLFNGIVGTSFVLLVTLGQWKDALFGVVVITNIAIGIGQEYRSKRTLDKLALLNQPHARVIRDGLKLEVDLEDIVLDDLIELRAGDQVLADAEIINSDALELDESLLTGESDPVQKPIGTEVLSGSIVVGGLGFGRVSRVGADTYASKLTLEARRFSMVNSELRNAINRIVKWLSWALLPVVLISANGQVQAVGGWVKAIESGAWLEAMVKAISSIITVVPQGLVLLTSLTFAVAAVKLARRQVLVQELPAVEGLARVDTICFDKTGTLTEGEIEFDETFELTAHNDIDEVLAFFGADEHANATARCLSARYAATSTLDAIASTRFSSARKWSSFSFKNSKGSETWVFGAPEFTLDGAGEGHQDALQRAVQLSATGRRVLVLAVSPEIPREPETLPRALKPVALVTFKERVRSDAAETIEYFARQGVTVKIISGDNPSTVAAVAREAGVIDIEGSGFDARHLPEDIDALAEVLEANTVFGRVTPEQKRNMVSALQSRGHVVAMTGDGVNDALALKRADLGIAMGSGSPATKAVSNLVLLDGKFSTLPGVVAEGRRVIANVERVSRLFLTKTMWALVLAFTFGALLRSYPFLPRQLSVVDVFTIGVPSFVLALLPNARRYEPGFLKRALSFCIPAGLAIGAAILSLDLISHSAGFTDAQQQTATMILISMTGLWTLTLLARPLDRLKGGIIALMLGLAAVAFGWQQFGAFFGFVQLGWAELSLPVALALAANALISVSDRFAPKTSEK